MKISTLIETLSQLQEKNGDADIVVTQRKSDYERDIENIYFEDYDKENGRTPNYIISIF